MVLLWRLNELILLKNFEYLVDRSKYHMSTLKRITILSKFKFCYFIHFIDKETGKYSQLAQSMEHSW